MAPRTWPRRCAYLQPTPPSPSTVWAAIRDSATLNKITTQAPGHPPGPVLAAASAPPPPRRHPLLPVVSSADPRFELETTERTQTAGVMTATPAAPRHRLVKAWLWATDDPHRRAITVTLPRRQPAPRFRLGGLDSPRPQPRSRTTAERADQNNGARATRPCHVFESEQELTYVQKSFRRHGYRGQTIRSALRGGQLLQTYLSERPALTFNRGWTESSHCRCVVSLSRLRRLLPR